MNTMGLLKPQRRDANEREIIDDAQRVGMYVQQMDKSAGFDLLVGWRGRLEMVEVKNPKHRNRPLDKLMTPAELETCRLMTSIGLRYNVVFDTAELFRLMGVNQLG